MSQERVEKESERPWGAEELQSILYERRIHGCLVRGLGDTSTVEAAALALEVTPEQIVKTLLFMIYPAVGADEEPRPVVVLSHGLKRVDARYLAARFCVGRKKVRMATAEQVLHWVGYRVGGVPPVGHRHTLPVLLDASVMKLQGLEDCKIFGGGGDDRTMLEISLEEILRLCQPEVLPLSDG